MKVLRWLMVIALIGLALMGCQSISETNEDEEAIASLINETPVLSFEREYEDTALIHDTIDTNTKEPVIVVGWWRKIFSVSRSKEIQISGDTAWVTIKDHIYGRFNLLHYDISADSTFTTSKTFHDLALRKALFIREGNVNDRHRGWVFKKTSFVEVNTLDLPDSVLIGSTYIPVNKIHIDSIKLTYIDTLNQEITRTFSNYSELLGLEDFIVVKAGTDLTLDIYSNLSEVFAFYYAPGSWVSVRRVRMFRDPDNPSHFYSIIRVPASLQGDLTGIGRSQVVNIISAPSFGPDNYPYVSHGVGFRIRVKG